MTNHRIGHGKANSLEPEGWQAAPSRSDRCRRRDPGGTGIAGKWAMQDLNLRLLPCEGSTLATELIAHRLLKSAEERTRTSTRSKAD